MGSGAPQSPRLGGATMGPRAGMQRLRSPDCLEVGELADAEVVVRRVFGPSITINLSEREIATRALASHAFSGASSLGEWSET